MSRLVPIRDLTHLRLALPAEHRWVHNLSWIPVSATEIHLACRYYPIAIRFEANTPRLGLIIDQRYSAHPLLTAAGTWRGAYQPIALRCYPFEAPRIDGDPLSDLLIDPDCGYLSETVGARIVDDDGRPSRLSTEVHRLFGLLQQGRESFAGALDHYLIGDLLLPLPNPDPKDTEGGTLLYILHPAHLMQLEKAALGAMARHSFMSIDVAMACHFSLQNLRQDCRPKDTGQSRRQRLASTPLVPDTIAIDDLRLALDDSELIALWDNDTLRADALA